MNDETCGACGCKGTRQAARPHERYRADGCDAWYCCTCGQLIRNPVYADDHTCGEFKAKDDKGESI